MRLRSSRIAKDLVAASTSASGTSKRGAVVAAAPSKRGKGARVEASEGGDGIWILGAPDQLVRAVLIKRPSVVIRSPYVADVRVEGESAESLAWVPCLDLGGTCVPGATLLMTRSTNPSSKTQYAVQVRWPGRSNKPPTGAGGVESVCRKWCLQIRTVLIWRPQRPPPRPPQGACGGGRGGRVYTMVSGARR
jgi:hypothetical protein